MGPGLDANRAAAVHSKDDGCDMNVYHLCAMPKATCKDEVDGITEVNKATMSAGIWSTSHNNPDNNGDTIPSEDPVDATGGNRHHPDKPTKPPDQLEVARLQGGARQVE